MAVQTIRVLNTTRGTVLGERIGIADTSLSRIVGLLGKTRLEPSTGLLIIPSQGVHTIAMRFPIDVVFFDKLWHVIAVHSSLAPNRVTSLRWKARGVIELPTGVITETSTSVGDELLVED